ncbi:MAG: ATP-binding cassette domain-containing protein [Lachnospiraceae bacterium]|nr:ATP-binding cassette domain-containing protein [Lachnospiraceae bacterium]
MICFEQVSKFILSDVSIHIPEGSSVGLIGASGAGKTTFLKLACGLLLPDKGYVHTLRKAPVKHRSELSSDLSAMLNDIPVFQEYSSVESSFRDLQIAYGMSEANFTKEYNTLSETLGFRSFEKHAVKDLSLGQRRRAELGALLLPHPKLLLLDEPTIGLDQNAKEALRELLAERQKEGMTLVISSHDMVEISALCERIALLDHGTLTYYGDKELLLKRFAPMDALEVTFSGRLPDLEDLPLARYSLNQNKLTVTYNSNHVTSAEVLHHILKQTSLVSVTTHKSELADVIKRIEKGETNEFYRSQ